MLRWSLYGSLVLVLAVFAWRGVYRTRPMLTVYLLIYLISRFPQPHPKDPAWVHAVYWPMTSGLLLGRALVMVESLVLATRELRERWYVVWGSIALGCAAFSAMAWLLWNMEAIWTRRYAQVGMAIALLAGLLYLAVHRHRIAWRELPVLLLLWDYAAISVLAAGFFFFAAPAARAQSLVVTSWGVVLVCLLLAVAHGFSVKQDAQIKQR